MTERGRAALLQTSEGLAIGPSQMSWDGKALSFEIDEVAVPIPQRVRGSVRVLPRALTGHAEILDAAGQHHWRPFAPSARIEVRLTSPALRWSGEAYFDSNRGAEPLEKRLRGWNWSRGTHRGETLVLYDVEVRDGSQRSLAMAFDDRGSVRAWTAPQRVQLPPSGWRIGRATRSEDGEASVVRSLEDTPFYARSLVSHRLLGNEISSVHESLDLDRFDSRLVQAMLPFRMPRRG